MATPKRKVDLWPLIVGVIAAVGIIGSNSTGGITGHTRDPNEAGQVAVVTIAASTAAAEPPFRIVSFTE